jgi:hypothetical protein
MSYTKYYHPPFFLSGPAKERCFLTLAGDGRLCVRAAAVKSLKVLEHNSRDQSPASAGGREPRRNAFNRHSLCCPCRMKLCYKQQQHTQKKTDFSFSFL